MTREPASLAPGRVVAGKLRIERVIGEGAMGVVLAALHLKLDQRVAIKILRGSLDEGRAFDRFAREARAVAKIESEHVARVLDVGALEDDTPYLVLEYLDGKDLAAKLREEGKVSIPRAVDWILEACEALAEAHANGVIHRDVKPSNLFLAKRSDGSSMIKVLDFGISKWSADSEELTATSDVVGSPAYMAPEQLRDARSVDARSDVWSLGVTLFELCAGALPWAETSIQGICDEIMRGTPLKLGAASPEAPIELEAIIARCLDRVPAKRFATIGELATALAPLGTTAASRSLEKIARWDTPAEDVRSTLRLTGETAAIEAAETENDPRATRTSWDRQKPLIIPGPSRAIIGLVALFAIAGGALALSLALRARSPREAIQAAASAALTTTPAPVVEDPLIAIDLDSIPSAAASTSAPAASTTRSTAPKPRSSAAAPKARDPFGDRE